MACIVPIGTTMAPAVVLQYGRNLKNHPQLRDVILGFMWIALFAAGVAGFFGAMINKNAPVEGGRTIHVVQGGRP